MAGALDLLRAVRAAEQRHDRGAPIDAIAAELDEEVPELPARLKVFVLAGRIRHEGGRYRLTDETLEFLDAQSS
jgi:hypothetical protein